MNATAVLDDYLGELLLDAAHAQPSCATPAASSAVAAVAAPSSPALPPPLSPPDAASVAATGVQPRTAAVAGVAPVAPPPIAAVPVPVPPRTQPAAALPAAGATPVAAPAWQQRLDPHPHDVARSARMAGDHSSRWLRLRCGDQAYALELLKVQEVVLPVPLLPLRGAAPSMLGVMNLRGQVVPVIDLGLRLGAAAIDVDLQTRVVVLEEDGESLGLRVSAVEDVASLAEQQIEPPDNARICRISNNLFRGVARTGRPPMILLDASQLLH